MPRSSASSTAHPADEHDHAELRKTNVACRNSCGFELNTGAGLAPTLARHSEPGVPWRIRIFALTPPEQGFLVHLAHCGALEHLQTTLRRYRFGAPTIQRTAPTVIEAAVSQ